jgi:putative uncharacterized protein (fragment)
LLAFKEINEVTNAGITMVDKFIFPFLFGVFEILFFLSLSFIKRKEYKFSWLFDLFFTLQ